MNNMAMISAFLQTSVQMGTPILLATLGGIMCEKVGNMNLGIEGLMLLGAAAGFAVAYYTGNILFALLAAGLAGSLGCLIYAFITISLRGNQVVTGLALTIFRGRTFRIPWRTAGRAQSAPKHRAFGIRDQDPPFVGHPDRGACAFQPEHVHLSRPVACDLPVPILQ